MALTSSPARLFAPVQLSTTVSTLLTAGNKVILDKITATNLDSSSRTVDAYLVPSGGSADNTTKLVSAVSIGANASYHFAELVGHTLEVGETLRMSASANTVVTVRASGRQVTGSP
jgi:hypothetical protein